MSFWNSLHVKSARIEHKCIYCSKTISKGESYWKESGVWEGDFHSYNLCERCEYLADTFDRGEELSDFHETVFSGELVSCPSCGRSNLRDYKMAEDKMSCQCECDECDEKWTADFTEEGLKEMVSCM